MTSYTEKTVLVFVINENKILLVKRKNTWFENNKYLVPGGLVDENETVEQSASRELKEETNIAAKESDLENICHPTTSQTGDRVFENHYVLARNSTGEIKNLEPHRHSDVGWFSIEDLPENTSTIVTDILKLLQKQLQ